MSWNLFQHLEVVLNMDVFSVMFLFFNGQEFFLFFVVVFFVKKFKCASKVVIYLVISAHLLRI